MDAYHLELDQDLINLAKSIQEGSNVKEEVESLDELSSGLLNRYKNRAQDSVLKNMSDYTNKTVYHGQSGSKELKKATKRAVGIHGANDRLNKDYPSAYTKEEVELDESTKYCDVCGDDTATAVLKSSNEKYCTECGMVHTKKNSESDFYKRSLEQHLAMKAKKAKSVKEEVEELDELSKKTLGSYVKKASDQSNKMAVTANQSARGASDAMDKGDPHLHTLHVDNYKYAKGLVKKRTVGISKAVDKLTNEEFYLEDYTLEEIQDFMVSEDFDQLDELSKGTLSSYVNKAAQSARIHGIMQGDFDSKSKSARKPGTKQAWSKMKSDAQNTGWKRQDGIKTAVSKLAKEEVEPIDELSKKTLGSYVKKSKDDMADAAWEKATVRRNDNEKKFDALHNRMDKRDKGINKAVDKLTKEEVEPIDEISKSTLGSYIKKAAVDASNNADIGGQKIGLGKPGSWDSYKKSLMRHRGISKAVDKLTKEEVEEIETLAAKYGLGE